MKKEQEYYPRVEGTEEAPPLTQNGYVAKERKIISVICIIFLALLLLFRGIQLGGFLNRDRNLTVNNYKDYLQIQVVHKTVTDLQNYDIVVTAKKTFSQAEIDLNVLYRYDLLEKEEFSRAVHLTINDLSKGDTYTYSIQFEKMVYCRTAQVTAITGRLP